MPIGIAGGTSLRRRLFLLAAVAVLPLAALSAVGLSILISNQRDEAARAGVELARALATAVAAELGRSAAVVGAVATSPALDEGNLGEFYQRVTRALATQPHWSAIVLLDAGGRPLLDTRVPFGAPPPPLHDPAAFARVHAGSGPVVGTLIASPADDAPSRHAFSVMVPVVRDGVVRYVLAALVEPGAIRDIISRQRVPPDWVISIFDAAGQRVARSRLHDEYLAKPGAPSVIALMAQPADEGWGRTTALEGDPIYSAYSRVKDVQWTVATGIPRTLVDTAVWRSVLVFGGGFLLSIVFGVVAATGIARGISAPIAALGRAAGALGRREPMTAPVTDLEEIRQVADALGAAAEERARGEREREALLARAQHARAVAEAANRAKDEFLAMLGHELRNPLAAVSNAVALLERNGMDPEAAARARGIIARQTAQLARLTDDLLDAGRVITGKIALHREPLELAASVERALATIDVGRHRLERDLAPVWVDGDPTRLEQIVANLVGNALKYTREDGAVVVRVASEPGAAVLTVQDDGIGMAPELAARAAELFVQGDRALDRAAGGLGIGLTLVQRLAELHGGSVRVFSAGPNQGSEVTVRLPAIAAPAADAAKEAAAPAPAAPRARDVVVVEDNADAREALCELLAIAGHRVRAAPDGPSGLAAVLAEPPDVALVDVGLPGMDGYEVARRIRAAGGRSRDVMLVALTGYGLPEDRARALAAGFDRHLVKPVDWKALAGLLT